MGKRKPKGTHLDRRLVVKFTAADLKRIDRHVKVLGVADRSEFIRRVVMAAIAIAEEAGR